MKKIFLAASAALMLLSGCYDDSAILDRLNKAEQLLQTLQEQCNQQNTNITSLQTVVTALQNEDYVTSVKAIKEGDAIVAYELTFKKGSKVTISVAPAEAPVLGVKAEGGNYYWTLNGEYLTDGAGNKINASGVAPKLKIEEGNWFVSYDNGATWEKAGQATGAAGANGANGVDGDSMFQNVTMDGENVFLTLADGTVIVLPLVKMPTKIEATLTQVDALTYTYTVAIPLVNEGYAVSYDVEFGKVGVTSTPSKMAGNYYAAKYSCVAFPEGTTITNSDVKTIAEGQAAVEYTITLPEGIQKSANYMIVLKDAKCDDKVLPIEGAELVFNYSTHLTWSTSCAQNRQNYPGSSFAEDEVALRHHTLEAVGLTAYTRDVEKTYTFHPQGSCQYGGRDMCDATKSVFGDNADDWGTSWSGSANPNMAADGTWNGNKSAYGYGSHDSNRVMWALFDMNQVQQLSGVEWWRKGFSNSGTNQMEYYALDACTYVRYTTTCNWDPADAIYLGKAEFGTDEKTNLMATAWESVNTQYLLVCFKPGDPNGYHAISVDLFHE